MTKNEIELFNSFLSDLNMADSFRERFSEKCSELGGVSYEEYLTQVSEKKVFDFMTEEEEPDHELWLATADLWKEALQESEVSGDVTEERADAPTPEPEISLPEKYKFCPSCWHLKDVNDFGRSFLGLRNAYCRACYGQYRKPDFKHETADYSVYEAILINATIYLNMTLAQLLRDKQMNHCGLRHHEGQLFLVFCEQKHHRNLKFYKNGGVSINDKALCEDVLQTLGVSGDGPYHLHISTNRSKRFDAVTIQVLRAVTHRDYLEHPFVKPEEKQEENTAEQAEEKVEDAVNENTVAVQQPSTVTGDEQEGDTSSSKKQDASLTNASSTKGYKLCISCLRILPISDFHKNIGEYDGQSRICRSCTKTDFSHDSKLHYDAVYFGGRLFFDEYYSESLRDRRKCEISFDKNNLPHIIAKSPLYYNGSLKSSFTCSQHSGAVALRDEAILNVIEQAFQLDKGHAYRFELDYHFDNYGNMEIIILNCQLWYWKDECTDHLYSNMFNPQPTVQNTQSSEASEQVAEPVTTEPHVLTDEEVKEKMKEFFTLYPSITIKQLHGVLSQGYGADEETGINKYELGLAAYLKERDWKLQMPIRVIKYENF